MRFLGASRAVNEAEAFRGIQWTIQSVNGIEWLSVGAFGYLSTGVELQVKIFPGMDPRMRSFPSVICLTRMPIS